MMAGEPLHMLILGGTGEARALAAAALARFGNRLKVTSSLAGRTGAPILPPGGSRRGGFGGAAGLAAYLDAAQIDIVIDATHPFATRISAAAQTACRDRAVPLLTLSRPRWVAQAGDRWIDAADMTEAASLLPRLGRRAFLTIGRRDIGAFSGVSGVHFLVRLIDPSPAPLPLRTYELVLGRGPFTVESERLIMMEHAIDVLVTKASGGSATAAKLEAARALAIPVVMLRRPEDGAVAAVDSVDDALDWIDSTIRTGEEVAG